MKKEDITFSRLTDMNRLSEIHKLTHDSFVEGGLISPTPDGILDIYSHLDRLEETNIIVAEQDGKIIATCSVTKDNTFGLQSDKFFKEETDKLRIEHDNLGCAWRIVTAKQFRNDIRLIKKLIDYTAIAAKNLTMQACLYCFATKHEKIYARLIGAKTITRKTIYYQQGGNGNEFALMISFKEDYKLLQKEI